MINSTISTLAVLLMFCTSCAKPATPPQPKKEEVKVLPAANAAVVTCQASSYTPVSGDGLLLVAKKSYGKSSSYLEIALANRMKSPYTIFVGVPIVIPCISGQTRVAQVVQTQANCPCVAPRPRKVVKRVTQKVQPRVEKVISQTPPLSVTPSGQLTQGQIQTVEVVVNNTPQSATGSSPVTVEKMEYQSPKGVSPTTQTQEQRVKVTVNMPSLPAPIVTPQPPVPVMKKEEPKAPSQPQPAQPVAPTPTPVPNIGQNVVKMKPIPFPGAKKPVKGTQYTWSVWNASVAIPLEPHNMTFYNHADFGVIVGRFHSIEIEPTVNVNFRKDLKGFTYNNTEEIELVAKLVKTFAKGQASFSTGYAVERRSGDGHTSSQIKSAPVAYFAESFQGNQPVAHETKRNYFSSPPWDTWGYCGVVSPYERRNVICLVNFNQGVAVAKVGKFVFIPELNLRFGFDTEGNPWNNRAALGADLKIQRPFGPGSIDIRAGYQCARQYAGAQTSLSNKNIHGIFFQGGFWWGGRGNVGGI